MMSLIAQSDLRVASQPRRSWLPSASTAAVWLLIGLYLMVSLRHLDHVPPVYEDEPWVASTGWKLASEAVFGSDLFGGLNRMEQRYYDFMPLHPLFLALTFKLAGLGLFQARLESVVMGLLTLALTYWLARRLFGDSRIGLLAILFLVLVRLTGLTTSQVTGILLLDMARIARYDLVVPVFGLASLHAYLSARDARQMAAVWSLAAGLLAGLAGLGHLYGVFWLPVLLVLVAMESRAGGGPWARSYALLLAGFALAWLPYLVYVLADLPAWSSQVRDYANRFALLDPGWYLENLRQEARRYGPGLGPPAPAMLLRFGFWSTLIVLPISATALAWRAVRCGDRAARVLIVPLLLLPTLFALLLRLKLVNYTVTFAPLAAIAAAWGGLTCWTWLSQRRRVRWARAALAAVLLGVLVEGATRIATLETAAATTTPYYAYIERVRQHLPAGARVLALHNYWFGLEAFDVRSFVVPLSWTDPRTQPRPLRFDEGLERVAPDIVLLDRRMREHFEISAGRGADEPTRFYDWLRRHRADLVGQVDDSTYGLMEIYRINRWVDSEATRLGALVGDQPVQRPQLERVAVEPQLVTPGADALEQ